MTWFMEILRIKQKKTSSNQVLLDMAFNIAKNLKYDGYQCALSSMV